MKEIDVNKTAIKIIHADGFFPPGEAEACCAVVDGLQYVEKPYGQEIEKFSIVLPGIEPIFSKMLGEEVIVDKQISGVFRKPIRFIHFEHFDTLKEWCFIVALQKTTFNIYHHVKDIRYNDYGQVDAKTALDGWQFNYGNFFEWDVVTNIILEANQGVFFRPWCFHSLEDGVIQYYRLLPKDSTIVEVNKLENKDD